jgi:hypothetical protein
VVEDINRLLALLWVLDGQIEVKERRRNNHAPINPHRDHDHVTGRYVDHVADIEFLARWQDEVTTIQVVWGRHVA